MANLTQVLFGNRKFGAITYQENYDPETLTANLGDSTSMSEADVFSGAKPLSDSATLTDAIAKLVETLFADSATLTEARIMEAIKNLSDSTTMADIRAFTTNRSLADLLAAADSRITTAFTKSLSEITQTSKNLFGSTGYGNNLYSGNFTELDIFMRDGIVREILKIFPESLSVADNSVAIQQTKGFFDFVVLKSWLKMDLRRADPWTATSGSQIVESSLTLYDRPLYGSAKLYAASPKVVWNGGSTDITVWNKAVSITTELSLYQRTSYGASLYSTQPTIAWTKPGSALQNFTNENGQNVQES